MSENYRPFINQGGLNLSVAWATAFLAALEPHMANLTPLLIRVDNFENGEIKEDEIIRGELDKYLRSSCNTVANTIFPWSLWNPKIERKQLFERYHNILPLIKKCPANRNGIYFERLIAFGDNGDIFNQLEHVIQTYLRGNHRPSALQAMIFDPLKDHTNQRQRGFPCLQQIIFTKLQDNKLSITGIYASQYLLERAYGNYLGLCRLGQFVAHELGCELVQMNCLVAKAKLEATKSSVSQLAQTLNDRLEELGLH